MKARNRGRILEDAGRLIAASWNERQAKRIPMLFSPTIGCALNARHWTLWVRCPACHTTPSVDLRTVDHHPFAAIASLIQRSRAVRVGRARVRSSSASPTKAADELHDEHTQRSR